MAAMARPNTARTAAAESALPAVPRSAAAALHMAIPTAVPAVRTATPALLITNQPTLAASAASWQPIALNPCVNAPRQHAAFQ